eukprot:CAMPEP_0114149600 /NCGR_PEP_ID=MMETSP0043_2-20121206/22248_1 /TAXON_ID=464988 /ORGANISM="Hemiselmis andersenii, Strain CCMP644" /LENGTH=76 /DNA_ID=CAMNT_0001244259 /DNA_START=67 /DNA_END=297 /DNA_ORIENTATION=-
MGRCIYVSSVVWRGGVGPRADAVTNVDALDGHAEQDPLRCARRVVVPRRDGDEVGDEPEVPEGQYLVASEEQCAEP